MTGSTPQPRRAAVLVAAVLALALAAAGCAGGPGRAGSSGSGGGGIGEIHLFGLPIALDLDGKPGPDAVGVRVYASEAGRARGVALRDGRLEVLLFDGTVDAARIDAQVPLRTWTFGPRELAPLAGETSLGTGYQLVLRWAPARPAARAVTVLARFHPSKGPVLASEPTSIPIR